jgi:hypothetical protein
MPCNFVYIWNRGEIFFLLVVLGFDFTALYLLGRALSLQPHLQPYALGVCIDMLWNFLKSPHFLSPLALSFLREFLLTWALLSLQPWSALQESPRSLSLSLWSGENRGNTMGFGFDWPQSGNCDLHKPFSAPHLPLRVQAGWRAAAGRQPLAEGTGCSGLFLSCLVPCPLQEAGRDFSLISTLRPWRASAPLLCNDLMRELNLCFLIVWFGGSSLHHDSLFWLT